MLKQIVSILVILFSILSFCQDIRKKATEIIVKDSIPAMAYAIVSVDEIKYDVVGIRRITERDNKVKKSDYFHLGSNSKAITGILAAYLVESGKINWDTKFFDLFPELSDKSNLIYQNITLLDLLSHRARINAFTSGNDFLNLPEFKGNKKEKREQFAKYVLTLNPIENDEVYNYSNAGYSVAVLMLEKVTDKSWEELVKLVLTDKLNLEVSFGWPNRNFKNQPFGHWEEDKKMIALPPDVNYDLRYIEPGGDLSMKIKDYAKFIQLNLQGLKGKDNLLKAETYQFLHFGLPDYSIGWANFITKGNHNSEHAGSDGTFFSYTLIQPNLNKAFIILVNSGTEKSQEGVFEMIEELKRIYRD